MSVNVTPTEGLAAFFQLIFCATVKLYDIELTNVQLKCYPNPFTQEVTIEIQNPKWVKVTVDIYNLAGQWVKNLAGYMSIKWNGTNRPTGANGFPGNLNLQDG